MMDTILANALPIGILLALILLFQILFRHTKLKKTFLFLDLIAHLTLVTLMVLFGATMEELLLVLLAAMAIALI